MILNNVRTVCYPGVGRKTVGSAGVLIGAKILVPTEC